MIKEKIIKLEIGCGKTKHPGYLGLDKVKLDGVDIVCDLEKERIPLEDSTVDEIYSRYFFEHIADLTGLMEEIWRVSKNGAKIIIGVPYFNSVGAYKDPTHKRFFTYETFDYFTETKKLPSYYSDGKFKIIKKEILFYPVRSNFYGKIRFVHMIPIQIIANLFPYLYEHSFLKLFSASDLYVELEVIKKKTNE